MKIQYGDIVKNTGVDPQVRSRAAELQKALFSKADGKFTNFEDFINLPDPRFVPQVTPSTGNVKQVFLVGLGGSSLGPKAVYDVLKSSKFPKLHFIENVDRAYIDELMTESRDAAFVFICKSGKTFETLKNLEYLTSEKYKGLVKGENTYVVSVEGNHTWTWGKELGAKLFPMPEIISGRFQVFSAVTAVPLGLVGLDFNKFVEGSKKSLSDVKRSEDSASTRFQFYKKGLDSDVYFAFDERLKSLSEWYASITAESLGKADGGITPMVSIGSRDLHSIGQLYLQGKRNKFTTFLSLSNTDQDNLYILDAVKKAYDDAKLPYASVILDAENTDVLTCELGDFMQSKILETVFLGGLMGLNPYDQPGVELYKKYLQ
jgi:glucose-6-phosphate isomerase